jgi:hypothetical protein
MVQFLHANRLPRRDFQAVLATFRAVFPRMLVWEALAGRDYLLVGLTGDASYATIEERWGLADVKSHLESVGAGKLPSHLLRALIGDGRFAEAAAGDAPVVTDDHTHVEYSAPRGLVEDGRAETLELLARYRSLPCDTLAGAPDLLPGQAARAAMADAVRLMKRGQTQPALVALKQCAASCADDPAWRVARDEICFRAYLDAIEALRQGRLQEAVPLLQRILPESSVGKAAKARIDELSRRR